MPRQPGVPLPGLLRQRHLAALTQRQLAERAGLQPLTILRLENGGPARVTTIARLARVLNCKPADLIAAPDS